MEEPNIKTWVKSQTIPNGVHNGEIIMTEPRVYGEYKYLDIVVKFTELENNPELKYGVPNTDNISENSKLGRLLIALGIKFEENTDIDVNKILIGKKISFQVLNKPSKKDPMKIYANIVEDSISLQN